jgi:hypothetical protein
MSRDCFVAIGARQGQKKLLIRHRERTQATYRYLDGNPLQEKRLRDQGDCKKTGADGKMRLFRVS